MHEGHRNAKKFFNSATASTYDAVVNLTTFGRDSVWKNKIVGRVGKQESILDLACGTGILSSQAAARNPGRIAGLDLAFDYLLAAKRKEPAISFIQGTAEALPYRDGCFGTVISSYLAKYVDIQRMVDESWRVLKPHGLIIFHDFTYPRESGMQKLWKFYFLILRVVGLLIPSWNTVFQDLDKVIIQSDWVQQTRSAIETRGFQDITITSYTFGTAAIISAKKP